MARKIKARPWVKDPWFYSTAEGAELALLESAEEMSFRDKLQWLEDCSQFAERLHQAAKPVRERTRAKPSPFPS